MLTEGNVQLQFIIIDEMINNKESFKNITTHSNFLLHCNCKINSRTVSSVIQQLNQSLKVKIKKIIN